MPTRPDRSRGRKRLNRRLQGERFGRLTVVRYAGQHKVNSTKRTRWINLWLCRCDCDGTEVTIREHLLLEGRTTSCGCLRRKREVQLTPDAVAAQVAFRALLAKIVVEKAIPWRLLRARWLGEPSPIAATMGVQARTGKAFEQIMRRTDPRMPDESEARFLAEILVLRGLDKERFLKVARDAREAINALPAADRKPILTPARETRPASQGGDLYACPQNPHVAL